MDNYPNVNAPALGSIPRDLIESMRATRPWVKFLSILGFIGCGLIALVSIFFMFAAAGMSHQGPGAFSVLYALFGLLYWFPSLYLYRYATTIEAFLRQPDMENLSAALHHQKSFWRFLGIVTVTTIILYAVMMIVVVVGAAFLVGK